MTLFQGGTKLPAWPKISPIDGIGDVGWDVVIGGGGALVCLYPYLRQSCLGLVGVLIAGICIG